MVVSCDSTNTMMCPEGKSDLNLVSFSVSGFHSLKSVEIGRECMKSFIHETQLRALNAVSREGVHHVEHQDGIHHIYYTGNL